MHGINKAFGIFEVVVADDGSDERTRTVIETVQKEVSLSHSTCGMKTVAFKNAEILNKATLAAQYDYLLFTDGDCLPRADLLAIHAQFAQKNNFYPDLISN